MLERLLIITVCCTAKLAVATEYDPWFGRSLEFEIRFIGIYQHYDKLNLKDHNTPLKGSNKLGDLSLTFPYNRLSGELEFKVADTTQRSFCADCMKFTGRYLFLNENRDSLSNLTMGISLSQAFGKATQDLTLYHHSKFEADAHIAAGKEIAWNGLWSSRLWGVFGIGKGFSGAPWIFSEAALEQRAASGHFFRAFAYYRHGCGEHHHRLLTLWQLSYRFLDLGARYTHRFDNYWELTFQYAYRCNVKNGLANMNIFLLEVLYPFSL